MSVQFDQVKQKAGRMARRTLWIVLAGLLVSGIGYYVYRTYTISEVVPMYYRLSGINPTTVSIGPGNLSAQVTVANRKVSDGWFWDEDEKINTFSVTVLRRRLPLHLSNGKAGS